MSSPPLQADLGDELLEFASDGRGLAESGWSDLVFARRAKRIVRHPPAS